MPEASLYVFSHPSLRTGPGLGHLRIPTNKFLGKHLSVPACFAVTGNLLKKKILTTAAEEAVLNRLLVGGRGLDMATLAWLRRKR